MPQSLQLPLMSAKLFRAVFAGDEIIGIIREPLGMSPKGDLPTDQKKPRHGKQGPGVGRRNKEERCEHHGEIPVVDAAGGAAAVLEQKGLEGTEK